MAKINTPTNVIFHGSIPPIPSLDLSIEKTEIKIESISNSLEHTNTAIVETHIETLVSEEKNSNKKKKKTTIVLGDFLQRRMKSEGMKATNIPSILHEKLSSITNLMGVSLTDYLANIVQFHFEEYQDEIVSAVEIKNIEKMKLFKS